MNDSRSLKAAIEAIFAEYESRCLWFSGGADSRLLLEVMIETGENFGVLRFEDGWNRDQRRQTDAVMLHHNIAAFSYPAREHLLVRRNGEIAMASNYAVGQYPDFYGSVLLRDLVDDPEVCGVGLPLEKPVVGYAPIDFDCHIWGTRADDRHWAIDGAMTKSPRSATGGKATCYPLFDWTKAEVLAELNRRGIDLSSNADTGNINACSNCLHGERAYCPKVGHEIEPVIWDPETNLKLLNGVYGDHENHSTAKAAQG